MNHKKRRDKGLPYISSGNLLRERFYCRILLRNYNHMFPYNMPKAEIIYRLLGIKHKIGTYFEPPFHCDYGNNIHIGKRFYANYGCTILDTAPVKIGDYVLFGPNVSIFTAGHPIHPDTRKTSYEYAAPVTVGNNVWIGGGSIVLPGVTIGDNTVIGAGSVVTKDIPSNVVAVGNPCKVLRTITDEDKYYYFKDYKFDEKLWKKLKIK